MKSMKSFPNLLGRAEVMNVDLGNTFKIHFHNN